LDQQLDDKCVLVGYSMGGRLALGCVMSNPTKYSGLVLLSANPGLRGETERRARADSDQQLAKRLLREPLTKFLTDWYEQPLFATATVDMRQRWVEERRSLDRDYQAGLVSQLSVGRQPDFWPRLPDLKLPTLFIVGEHDAKYAAIAAEAHRRNANFRVQTIPNAGHAVHREAPACVSLHLIEFLAGVQTS
ncbi:MAG: alpha/beta fold hydrolase, partial [Planctomycetales bacterium]|nr:alpha/beta fold hydrolase [Planctomycetales bacterium]